MQDNLLLLANLLSNWAIHYGKYRGDWSPYVPRNLILRYFNPGE